MVFGRQKGCEAQQTDMDFNIAFDFVLIDWFKLTHRAGILARQIASP